MSKRYRITVALDVWSDNDEGAKTVSNEIVEKLMKYEDNNAQLIEIYETPFASLAPRLVQNE